MALGVSRLAAQINEDEAPPRGVITYRAKPEQNDDVLRVCSEEKRGRRSDGRKLTKSKVVEYLVGLGLDLYWARNSHGAALDSFSAEHGWDRRKTLAEVIRRGLGLQDSKHKR